MHHTFTDAAAAVAPTDYDLLLAQARALLEGETDPVANAANLAALCWQSLPDISWVGIYFWRADALILGPFQGKPACTRIANGAGVCGRAMQTLEVQRVDDVHAFPGHIACDSASASELVVPIVDGAVVHGVWDIDSTRSARFTEADAQGVAALMQVYCASLRQAHTRSAHG